MKKSKLIVLALLALLALSAAGCLFSFVYVSWQNLERQSRLRAARDFERQQQAAQELAREYRDWLKLPGVLQSFRDDHILSMDEFAAFRRVLDDASGRQRTAGPEDRSHFRQQPRRHPQGAGEILPGGQLPQREKIHIRHGNEGARCIFSAACS